MDISESGRRIGEKLLMFLTVEQCKELVEFLLRQMEEDIMAFTSENPENECQIEIQSGDLWLLLEQREVIIQGQKIELTAKEFDILALLMMNPKRVFTYEMITELIWEEDCANYSRKTISNHVSNLKKKLKIIANGSEYIKNVIGVGYKFDPSQ